MGRITISQRRRRNFVVFIFMAVLFASLGTTFDTKNTNIFLQFSEYSFSEREVALYYFFLASFFMISLTGMFLYNEYRKNPYKDSYEINASSAEAERDFGSQLQSLRREFEDTAQRAAQTAANRLSSDLDSRITRQVEVKVDNIIGDDVVKLVGAQLAKGADEYTWRETMREDLIDRFNTTRNRVDELAVKAQKSANIFRILGIILALLGLGLIGWKFVMFLAADFKVSGNDWTQFLITHETMTFPVVLLAEALALIMFRYHSRSLEQMRYFSNEVTTLSIRNAAALITVQQGTKKDIMEFAREMSREERNFILKKGEATLETTQNASEDALVQKILDRLKPVSQSGRARAKTEKVSDKDTP